MSVRYATVTKEVVQFDGWTCNGCQQDFPAWASLIEVRLEVHVGEEGGAADEFHYCDECFNEPERIAALARAGSTAPIVVGYPEDEDVDDDDG